MILRRRNKEVIRVKIKCIKRYSDVLLKKVIEVGTVLDVPKDRADHLVHEGVAELVEKAAQGKG